MFFEKIPQENIEGKDVSLPERLTPEIITLKIIEELVNVDKIAFEGIRVELTNEEIEKILFNPKAVHLILRNSSEEIVGYITSLPHNESYTFLSNMDKEMTAQDSALYLESMAILPEYRGFKSFTSLINKIFEEGVKSGYKKLTMHARVLNGVTDVLQKRYGAEFIRRVYNFYDTDESFDYLELILDKDIV